MPAHYRVDDITLEGRFDSIKTDAVVSAAHQETYSACAQQSGMAAPVGSPRRIPPRSSGVPQLLADHTPFIGELLHRGNERHGIASRGEFVVARARPSGSATHGQPRSHRKRSHHPSGHSLVIVAAPARALRQVAFEQAIHDRNGIPHEGIVRATNAQPHQEKKITADNVPGGLDTAAIGNCEQRGIGVGVRIGRIRITGIDRM